MRPATALAFILLASACHDAHPREVVGTWVNDSLWPPGYMRTIDTLELTADGTGRNHFVVHSYITSLQRDGGLDTTRADDGPVVLNWEVMHNEEGRYLCLADSAKRRCATLRVIPETELKFGTASYERVRAP